MRISSGKECMISARLFSIFSVTLKVFTLGCLETEIITAELAFCEAYPIFLALPITTSAMSEITIGLPLTVFTQVCPNSSKSNVRAIPLNANSLW